MRSILKSIAREAMKLVALAAGCFIAGCSMGAGLYCGALLAKSLL